MILKNGKRIDGCSDTVPVGTLNPFLGATAPFGYLICQGQRVSKTTYPELYTICGSTFGPETSTEFYLPDLRGQTIAGYKEGDATFGTLGGLIGSKSISYTPAGTNSGGSVGNHTLTTSEIPSHSHGVYGALTGETKPITNTGNDWGVNTTKGWTTDGTSNTGGDGAHNHGFTNPTFTGTQTNLDVVQPTVVMNWIVKAVMLIPNQSTVVNIDSDSSVNVYSCDYMNDLLEQMKQEAFDFAHPVGSYYETSDSTWTPQAAGWYGTWVADNDGSALVSYKSSGAFNKATGTIVGGESQAYTPAGTNTGGTVGGHVLTVAEMPSHNHSIEHLVNAALCNQGGYWNGDNQFHFAAGRKLNTSAFDGYLDNSNLMEGMQNTGSDSAHNHPFTQPTFTGTAATLSTIQTSKVVYRWHRTA